MVTTRRGKTTAAETAVSPKGKAKAAPKNTRKSDAGNVASAENEPQQKQQSKKRSAEEAANDTAHAKAASPKRQRKAENGNSEADLQVKFTAPSSIEERSAIPEADTITAAAAMDPPAGSETAVSAEDLAPTPAAPAEEPKPDVTNTQEMPVEDAVKVIGGTQAGSAPVSEAPTAGKALDAVPVGPDPAAADDTPQDGDYFLDANLADSMQGNARPKADEQVTESMATNDATKTGFLAPPASGAPPSMDGAVGGGVGGQTGMAAEAGNALTDLPPGIQADKTAIPHSEGTDAADAMHEPITAVPSTVDAHDSHFGAAAVQDANDTPAIFGGDNA